MEELANSTNHKGRGQNCVLCTLCYISSMVRTYVDVKYWVDTKNNMVQSAWHILVWERASHGRLPYKFALHRSHVHNCIDLNFGWVYLQIGPPFARLLHA